MCCVMFAGGLSTVFCVISTSTAILSPPLSALHKTGSAIPRSPPKSPLSRARSRALTSGGPEAGQLKGDGEVQHRVVKGDVLWDVPSGS